MTSFIEQMMVIIGQSGNVWRFVPHTDWPIFLRELNGRSNHCAIRNHRVLRDHDNTIPDVEKFTIHFIRFTIR